MCSASGHVLQMPLWASTRRSERFYPLGAKEKSCKRRISVWKPMEGSQGNCPKFGRLYASVVKRSRPKWGGKMPLHGLTEKRTDRKHHFPHKWAKRNLLFFERVPNVPGKTFAVFPAFYSFLSNGQFCPLALYGKAQ